MIWTNKFITKKYQALKHKFLKIQTIITYGKISKTKSEDLLIGIWVWISSTTPGTQLDLM